MSFEPTSNDEIDNDPVDFDYNELDNADASQLSSKKQNKRNYSVRKQIERKIEMQRLKRESQDVYDDWD
jgi:hypothetical protein